MDISVGIVSDYTAFGNGEGSQVMVKVDLYVRTQGIGHAITARRLKKGRSKIFIHGKVCMIIFCIGLRG